MRIQICFSVVLTLLRAGAVVGWAHQLERSNKNLNEDQILQREWYTTKVVGGPKVCRLSPGHSDRSNPVRGISITNFGPEDAGLDELPEAPKEWRDLVGWVGFWKNRNCDGLPNILVHFYSIPYTRQVVLFNKIFAADPTTSLVANYLKVSRLAQIPFGDIYFHGQRHVPEGSIAIRQTPATVPARAVGDIKEAEFLVFRNAIKVKSITPNNEGKRVDFDTQKWDGSGEITERPQTVTLRTEGVINISAQPGDREMQVKLGLVPGNRGRGEYSQPPTAYRNLLLGQSDEERLRREEQLHQAYQSMREQWKALGYDESQPQDAGPLQLGNELRSTELVQPTINDAHDRLNKQDIISILLQTVSNWEGLSEHEKNEIYNEYVEEQKQWQEEPGTGRETLQKEDNTNRGIVLKFIDDLRNERNKASQPTVRQTRQTHRKKPEPKKEPKPKKDPKPKKKLNTGTKARQTESDANIKIDGNNNFYIPATYYASTNLDPGIPASDLPFQFYSGSDTLTYPQSQSNAGLNNPYQGGTSMGYPSANVDPLIQSPNYGYNAPSQNQGQQLGLSNQPNNPLDQYQSQFSQSHLFSNAPSSLPPYQQYQRQQLIDRFNELDPLTEYQLGNAIFIVPNNLDYESLAALQGSNLATQNNDHSHIRDNDIYFQRAGRTDHEGQIQEDDDEERDISSLNSLEKFENLS